MARGIDGLVHVDPHIHGRARAAWKVTGCNGERLLVKRTWDVKELEESMEEPEATMLIKAGNVSGIARLALYSQETTGYTSDAPHSQRDPTDFGELYKREQLARRHRILVIEYFERDIMQVRSNEELLLVLRDAVQAHGELWKIGICHRDICPKDIRIKEEGCRSSGVLVGLDKAKPVTEQSVVVPCMPDVVNKNMFQSRYVLRVAAEPKSKKLYPSLWDDLESFFYVLCFLCSTDSKGIRDMFSDWASENPGVSLEAKSTFCVACQPSLSWNLFVDPYFGPVFMKLLAGMHRSLHSYDEDRSRGHETFLALIDTAIIELSNSPELVAVDIS
ncbi:hypothetical protein BDN70DRAFT_719900 [Pholiota conissans]|uniref:Fungal-type protein kinase domain-containing protein n=1 Tax=Pholiota conissans TaxID=109636 RepID=A0A9P6D015_9AGAR|nr:hypothetical protein BDN70DRAFT_719900 [Pholiota conissans]